MMLARRAALLGASHLAALGLGFAGGIYALPILTAPPSLPQQPSMQRGSEGGLMGEAQSADAADQGRFAPFNFVFVINGVPLPAAQSRGEVVDFDPEMSARFES